MTNEYFDGTKAPFKIMRFLNLLEDGAVKLSLSGFTLWITTLQNLHVQIFSHDTGQQAFGLASNVMGMLGHVAKRWKTWRKVK